MTNEELRKEFRDNPFFTPPGNLSFRMFEAITDFWLAKLEAERKELRGKIEELYLEKGKPMMIAETIGKQPVSHGPIAQARVDGFRVALAKVLKLLS